VRRGRETRPCALGPSIELTIGALRPSDNTTWGRANMGSRRTGNKVRPIDPGEKASREAISF
jgi:hypothetical protein